MARENILDLSGILDEETFHEYVSKKVDFPGHYGYNLDALWDCITDEEQSSMPMRLVVEGLSDLKCHQPKLFEGLMGCLNDYIAHFPNREVILRGGSPSGEGIEFEGG